MNPVNRRPVRVKCQIKGCPNIGAFAFSRSTEPGNTPIICAACAKEIGNLMGLTEGTIVPKTPNEPKKTQTKKPPVKKTGKK